MGFLSLASVVLGVLAGCSQADEAPPQLPLPPEPKGIEGPGEVSPQLALGDFHACSVDAQQQLSCWGRNDAGQGVVPDHLQAAGLVYAVDVGLAHSCAIVKNGSVTCWGADQVGQLQVPDLLKQPLAARALALAGDLSCALLHNQSLHCWGGDQNLVQPSWLVPGRIAAAHGSGTGICVMTTEGTASCYYRRSDGSVTASGAETVRVASVASGSGQDCAVTPTGGARCWNHRRIAEEPVPSELRVAQDVEQISSGFDHACALLAGGRVRCWGAAENGETEVPAALSSGALAVASGPGYSCGRDSLGNIVCWGLDTWGQASPTAKAQPSP